MTTTTKTVKNKNKNVLQIQSHAGLNDSSILTHNLKDVVNAQLCDLDNHHNENESGSSFILWCQ